MQPEANFTNTQNAKMLNAVKAQRAEHIVHQDIAKGEISKAHLYQRTDMRAIIKRYQPWYEQHLAKQHYVDARLDHIASYTKDSYMRRALLWDAHHEIDSYDIYEIGKRNPNPDTQYDKRQLKVYASLMDLERTRAKLVVQAKAGDDVALVKAQALKSLLQEVVVAIDNHFTDHTNPFENFSKLQSTISQFSTNAFRYSPELAQHRSWASEIVAKLLYGLSKIPLIGSLIKAGITFNPKSATKTETEQQIHRMEAAIATPS